MSQIVYSNISSINWKPVEFYTPGYSFNLKKQSLQFNSGCSFNLYDFLYKHKDYSLNNKTFFVLTNLKNNKDLYEKDLLPNNSSVPSSIQTPIAIQNINGLCLIENQNNIAVVDSKKTFGLSDNLTIKFNSESASIVDKNGKFLTLNNSSLGSIAFFTDENSLLIQKFDYSLGPRDICLFIPDSNYNRALGLDPDSIQLQVVEPISLHSSNIKLRLISYNNLSTIEQEKYIQESFVSKYIIDPLNFNKDLKLNSQNLSSAYSQNYLAQFSLSSPISGTNFYELNIHPLKNYQTPEYLYTNSSSNTVTDPNRKYKHIFSGSNQTDGLNNVFLGFESETEKIVFKEDVQTTFEYPSSVSAQFLQSSRFIEDGASGGPLPFISDRILAKDYQTTPIPVHPSDPTMKWMCSWLFKDNEEEYIWLDRYYDSDLYSLKDAISATFSFDQNNVFFNFESFEDLPSFLQLTPGHQYTYTHIGKKTYNLHLDYLENYYKDFKALHIRQWNKSPLVDENNPEIKGFLSFNSKINYDPSVFDLDGSNHVTIPIVSDILPSSKFTANVWVRTNNWPNTPAGQIFGNYYKGGFGLLNDSSEVCPIFSLLVKDSSGNFFVTHFNYLLKNLGKQKFENQLVYSNINFIVRLQDFGFWAFDTFYGKAYKFRSNGSLELKIDKIFPEYTENGLITQIEINSLEEIFVYSNTKQQIKKISPRGYVSILSNLTIPSTTKRFEIDSKNNLIFSNATVSTIDNEDNLWEVFGQNIYKNKNNPLELNPKITILGPIHQLAFDSYNNLWISHAVDKITKFNSDGRFQFSNSRIGKRVGLNESSELQNLPIQQYRFINFIKKPSTCDNNLIEDVCILVDTRDEEIFFIEQNGFLRNRLNLNAFVPDSDFLTNSFYCAGDMTGFNYLRKFKNKIDKSLSWKLKTITTAASAERYLSLDYNYESLSPGWHMFSLIFDGKNGLVEYYIDTSLVKSVSLEEECKISYDLKTPLLIGAFTHQNFVLNDLLEIDNIFKFNGQISDLRLYNTNISIQDLITIFYTTNPSLQDANFDLIWNKPIGTVDYIEGIEHWFKNQLPGHKSNYFNVNIHNLNAPENVKQTINNAIRNNIHKLIPTHTHLYKINWK